MQLLENNNDCSITISDCSIGLELQGIGPKVPGLSPPPILVYLPSSNYLEFKYLYSTTKSTPYLYGLQIQNS